MVHHGSDMKMVTWGLCVQELSAKSARYRSSHIFFSHRLEACELKCYVLWSSRVTLSLFGALSVMAVLNWLEFHKAVRS